MSFASGHIIAGYTFGKIYEKIKQIKIPQPAWFFIIFGALLPDADFIIEWLFKIDAHRLLTHSILFLIVAPFLILAIFHLLKSPNKKIFAIALAIGILSHLTLDFCTTQGIPLLYPNLTHFSIYGINENALTNPSFLHQTEAGLQTSLKLAVLDMALGATFLFYLWWKKRIQF